MQIKLIVTQEMKQAVWHWTCMYYECSIGGDVDVRCVIKPAQISVVEMSRVAKKAFMNDAAESVLEISDHGVGDEVYVTHEEKLATAHMINYYNARDL